jgi:hypothetical protein
MKRITFAITASLLLVSATALAQDIPQSQVPSVVLNHFKKAFPKAYDIEWEIKNKQYCAAFETKLSKDHKACYNTSGELLKHTEDISARVLPGSVRSAVKNNFSGYRIDDVKKITTGSTVQYSVELKSIKEELKVYFDDKGNILKQHAD